MSFARTSSGRLIIYGRGTKVQMRKAAKLRRSKSAKRGTMSKRRQSQASWIRKASRR